MTSDAFRKKLRGVIAFPVTPFSADLSLNIAGLRKNIRHLMKHPFAALVAAGGTGEFYSLSPDEYVEVVRAIVEEVAGRVPVIAGTGFNRALAVELARQARGAGANAILALPPYYPNADDEGLADYYAAIGEATPLPLIIYSRDWVNPGAEWVERLAARVPTLAAWKDGQGDIRRYHQIIARLGDRLHWIGGIGDDCVPGYYSIGIRVFTSSISTVTPIIPLLLDAAASAGDQKELDRLMREYVLPLYAMRARRKGYEVTVMKQMMDFAGLAGGPVRPPLPKLRPAEIEEVRAMVERWKPVLEP
jgi:5-dehydro-4-deoxyglucarate dehydratase